MTTPAQDYGPIIAVAKLRANLVLDDGDELGGMSTASLIMLIDDALDDYSKDKPRKVVQLKDKTDVTSANQTILTSIIPGQTWDPSTDFVHRIQNPIDQQSIHRQNKFEDYNDKLELEGGGHAIQFRRIPADEWRITMFVHWTVLTAAADKRAKRLVGVNAAAKAARVKEAKFADMRDAPIVADSIDYEGKAALWDSLASSLEAEYARGIQRPTETKSAGNRVRLIDLDPRPQNLRRGRYLVHRPDTR